MRKLIPFTVLAMLLTTGVASADRRGHHDRDRDRQWRGDDHQRRGTIVIRDRRDHRRDYRPHRVQRERIVRAPVYIRGGAFHFHGGIVKRWRAPVITRRYFDVRVQPAPVAEYYDSMPGYVWQPGQWQWSGYEWQWIPGHYAVDTSYYDDGQGYYDGDYGAYDGDYGAYDDGYYSAPQGVPNYPSVPPPAPYRY